ncbi:hypothetical protein WKI65_26505 [Streptomyces sp. MS1.AVA.3]|uniref:hypothetical protein n=1 Tax=Streptomyces decoyicus TaxID=249567 RepID=UPI0030C58E0C
MSDTPDCRLTPEQKTRLELTRADLSEARSADLAGLSPPALIFLVEQLRESLHEALELIDDITDTHTE